MNGNGSRVCPEKTKRGHRGAGDDSVLRAGKGIELGAIRQAQIISRREAHRAADIQRGIRTKDNPGRIHEEQIGAPEADRLNGPEDIGWVAAGDATQDIGSG